MSAQDRATYAHSIEALIEQTVRAQLGEIVDGVETRFDQDQQGDASIFVDVFLTAGAPDNLGRRFVDMQLAVMAALEAFGEIRFPYLSTKRPNDDYPEDVLVKPRKRQA